MTPLSIRGYKERALRKIQALGLPTVKFVVLTSFITVDYICDLITQYYETFGAWAVRFDTPENTGRLLPLCGSNRGHKIDVTARKVYDYLESNPNCSCILSSAPLETERDSNFTAQKKDGILYGEIGFEKMTLRDAFTIGKVYGYCIDNTIRDYFRISENWRKTKSFFRVDNNIECTECTGDWIVWGKNCPSMTPVQIEYLRKVHNLLPDDSPLYEVSAMNDGSLIFWQELPPLKDIDYIGFNWYTKMGGWFNDSTFNVKSTGE